MWGVGLGCVGFVWVSCWFSGLVGFGLVFLWGFAGCCGVLWGVVDCFYWLGPKQAPEIQTPQKYTWYFFIYLVIFGLPRKKAVEEVEGSHVSNAITVGC